MTELEQRLSAASMARVPVRVSVELGRCRQPLADAVTMTDGMVVELDREPEDLVDIYVDGVHYGTGRLGVVGGEWAVEIVTLHAPRPDQR